MGQNGETKKNGFGRWTWSDIILLATLFIGGLVWGMKLEGRYDALDTRIRIVEGKVSKDILPRAEERLKDVDRRLDRLEKREE